MLSAGLVGAMTGQVIAELPVFLIPPDSPIALILVSLAALVLVAFVLATAYGMWSLQTWGWRLQIVVCFTDILLNAHALLLNPPSAGSLFAVAGLFIDSGILVYVSRSQLRDWYADQGWDSEEWGEPPKIRAAHPVPLTSPKPSSLGRLESLERQSRAMTIPVLCPVLSPMCGTEQSKTGRACGL